MKNLKLLVLSAMAVVVLAISGCGDRSYDAESKRSVQQSEELRDRIKYNQDDR